MKCEVWSVKDTNYGRQDVNTSLISRVWPGEGRKAASHETDVRRVGTLALTPDDNPTGKYFGPIRRLAN